jgi:hypothetical protein
MSYYWECQPNKDGDCPDPLLPDMPLPGVADPWKPWLRHGLHTYKPGYAHEAMFFLKHRPDRSAAFKALTGRENVR